MRTTQCWWQTGSEKSKRMMDSLSETCNMYGMEINVKKIKGAFHAKSTNFRIKSDMTIFNLDEIWWVCSRPWKKIIPKILDFLVKCSPKYRSTKFGQNAPTRTGQDLISQLLWDLQSSSLYQMKGNWEIYLNKYSRFLNSNK